MLSYDKLQILFEDIGLSRATNILQRSLNNW